MSTLVLDTITGKSTATTITIGSTPVVSASANSMTIRGEGSNQTSIQQGLTKMWVQHNDGASVADSFNVGSTTDNGTGDYTHAFSNNMRASNNYSVSGMAQDVNSKNCQLNMMSSNAEYAAASFRYQTGFVANTSGGQTNHDCNGTSVQICGDLA
jgi:hypothetical protein